MKPTSHRLRYLPLAAIAAIALIGALTLRDTLSFATLAEHRQALLAFRDANYAATAAAFVAAYVAIVAFSLPGATLVTLVGGFLFGLFPGVLFNVTGATLGATAIFLAARWGLGERLAARLQSAGGRIGALKRGIDENQWSMLFLIRLVPAVPFFIANLMPALVGVPLYRFVISTFLGIIPAALIYTAAGAGLGDILARGETPDSGILTQPHILLPLLGLAALAALPMLLRMLRKGPAT